MKSRSNSENSSVENGFPVQESSAEAGESVVEEKYDAQPNDDPFPDWESGRTSPNNPSSSSQGCSSEGESEKVRIVDIIKRLTAATQMQSPRSSSCGDDNDHEQYSMLGSPFRERNVLIGIHLIIKFCLRFFHPGSEGVKHSRICLCNWNVTGKGR